MAGSLDGFAGATGAVASLVMKGHVFPVALSIFFGFGGNETHPHAPARIRLGRTKGRCFPAARSRSRRGGSSKRE